MRRIVAIGTLTLSLFVITGTGSAQGLLDGLRLTTSPTGSGARGMAMSGAMIAAANDWSALEYNPAALTLVEHNEFNAALFNKVYTSNAPFVNATIWDPVENTVVSSNATASNDITNTIPYSFAYAAPVPTERGHLAFALSIDRIADFTSTYKFSAINPTSSFINTQGFVNDPGYHGGNFSNYLGYLDQSNLAWATFLTYGIDSAHPALTTPFNGKMLQSGTVTQEGGLNAFRLGGGVDVSENVAVGATLNFMFGSYDYRRTFSESDVNGVYAKADSLPPYNLKSATVVDTRSQSISGFSLKLGLYAEPNEYFKVGVTFTTPSIYSFDDHFYRWAAASFTTGFAVSTQDSTSSVNPSISNSYTVTTPMVLGAGVSFNQWGLTLAASFDYTDYSQLHFGGSDVDLSDLNDAARSLLHGVLTWRIGGEYFIKPVGMLVRGGYYSMPSAYKHDPSNFGAHSWSAGLGFLLSKSTILEFSYRNTTYRTDHSLYNDFTVGANPVAVSATIPQDDVKLDELAVSFSFRF